MVRSMHGRHSGKLTAPLGQCARFMTIQAVGTELVRSHAILKSLPTTLTSHQSSPKSNQNVVAVHMVRSMHGRHSGKLTAPLGQCAHFMTLQAIGTALV